MALEGLYQQIGQAPGQLVNQLMQNKGMNADIAAQQAQIGQGQQTLDQNQQLFDAQQQAQTAAAAKQQTYNALLQQYLGPEQGALAAQGMGESGPAQGGGNALLSQLYQLDPQKTAQLVQFQQAQAAEAQKQQQAEAQQAVRSAQYVLESKAPKALVKLAFPQVVAAFEDQGMDFDDLNDDQVRQIATGMIEQYGPVAGIGPAKKETPDQFAKINPGDYTPESVAQFQKTGNFADLRKAQAAVAADPNQGFTRANVLRDEFNAANKDFGTVQAQYGNILSTAKSPSAAGDLSLIFSYMKMLDPASTVREGEFANAEKAGGVPSRIRAQYNKLLNGERLESGQRADFVKQAAAIFSERQKQADKNRDRYSTLAKRAGVDPIDVVGEMDRVDPSSPPAAPNAGRIVRAPEIGAVQDGYRFKGGDPADSKNWTKL